MECNVGSVDRLLRIIVGLVVAIVGVIFDSWWGLVGLIPLSTGLFKFCPLYIPLKINTSENKKK
ncbi:Protein of unknown function [Mariniphaga anaerophila]|uniref:Inner membrane protein YgaP-like transmembrane domain-containing protein n=1 Tax=Mariniphaga anaerophila TaxID=1484053 RepID=A0A1M5CQU7_9BACT|nr:DUF2892 domain-containing protein [Mariniphaga anaerophila]SHF57016.1 Protein of unknown function [Mariniphaga anaerophila]